MESSKYLPPRCFSIALSSILKGAAQIHHSSSCLKGLRALRVSAKPTLISCSNKSFAIRSGRSLNGQGVWEPHLWQLWNALVKRLSMWEGILTHKISNKSQCDMFSKRPLLWLRDPQYTWGLLGCLWRHLAGYFHIEVMIFCLSFRSCKKSRIFFINSAWRLKTFVMRGKNVVIGACLPLLGIGSLV